eukprot:2186844-Prorocentrum_lima.AAC.1
MPTSELSRMSMARERQMTVSREPRTILAMVKDTMETVASRDDILQKVMMEELSYPALRHPQNWKMSPPL